MWHFALDLLDRDDVNLTNDDVSAEWRKFADDAFERVPGTKTKLIDYCILLLRRNVWCGNGGCRGNDDSI